MRQQVGRAGRTHRRAAAVLIAGDDQLDQWYARHPSELLERPAEAVVVNPDNPFVARAQIACAAHELPLTHADDRYFGDALDDAVRGMVLDDELKPRGGAMFWAGREPPAARVGLRTGSSVECQLVDPDGRLVGTVDSSRAFHVAHPGAMYLHQGRQYRVRELDVEHHVAVLDPADDADEHTQTREQTDISIVDTEQSVPAGAGTAHLGAVTVLHDLVAYQRKRTSTNEVFDVVPLDFPPRELTTRACWYTIPLDTLLAAGLEPSRIIGAVHAAEHALIGLLPLFAICDRWDVGGVSMALHPQTGDPTIFVYDGYPAVPASPSSRSRSSRVTCAPRTSSWRVPVRRRVPLVRAVTEVRQLERVPRQGRGDRGARGPRRVSFLGGIPRHRPHVPLDSGA